jgi:ribose/xylose/arabinose/galactoside ABC-type transport system permease subunit
MKTQLQKFFNAVLKHDESGVVLSIAGIVIVTQIFRNDYISIDNIKTIFTQVSFVAIVALGASIPLMAGNIDISTGRTAGLGGIIMASLVVNRGWSAAPAIILGLIAVIIVGIINGLLVVYCKVNDFIATMGTLYMVGGARFFFVKGHQLSFARVPNFNLHRIFQNRYFGMPIYFWIMLILVILVTIVIKKTVFGRRLLMTGDNSEVAQLAGINVNRTRFIAYIACALFAGIAGILLTLSLGLGLPENGDGWEFRAIAGTVVGGTSLMGGKSSPLGTFLGVSLMFIAENAFVFLGLPGTMRIGVQGFLMALAVVVDLNRQRRKIPA